MRAKMDKRNGPRSRTGAIAGFKAAQDGGDINKGRARLPPAGLRLCARTVSSLGKAVSSFIRTPRAGS